MSVTGTFFNLSDVYMSLRHSHDLAGSFDRSLKSPEDKILQTRWTGSGMSTMAPTTHSNDKSTDAKRKASSSPTAAAKKSKMNEEGPKDNEDDDKLLDDEFFHTRANMWPARPVKDEVVGELKELLEAGFVMDEDKDFYQTWSSPRWFFLYWAVTFSYFFLGFAIRLTLSKHTEIIYAIALSISTYTQECNCTPEIPYKRFRS